MSNDLSEVRAIASETSVNIQLRTWQYIPEDSELQAEQLFTATVTAKY
jgi:hypothetical protein